MVLRLYHMLIWIKILLHLGLGLLYLTIIYYNNKSKFNAPEIHDVTLRLK